MKLGIWTPLPHTIRAEPAMEAAIGQLKSRGGENAADKSFQFAVEVVRKAEDYGFETTLIAERFLGPDLEAWILSAALARETRHIELMVAVHPGIVNPQVAAKMGASLDRISSGRCAINIVNGWWKEEFDLFSNGAWQDDPERRYRRMDEFIQVMKGLWTEETFSLDGSFYKVESGSLPIKPCRIPHPPIYAASRTEAGKEIIARQGDVWFVAYQPGYALAEENIRRIAEDIRDMNRRSRSYGREIRYGISAHVICADSLERAESQVAELEAYGKRDPVSAVAARALGAGLVGTPESIAGRLRHFEEIGIDCLMLHFHPMLEGLETFAREIMPRSAR